MKPKDFMDDDLMRMLDGLPDYEPDPAHSRRVRARCHAALQARRRAAALSPAPVLAWRLALEFTAIGFVCAGFLTDVVRRALALYGF
jgi:hypothetical protein